MVFSRAPAVATACRLPTTPAESDLEPPPGAPGPDSTIPVQ